MLATLATILALVFGKKDVPMTIPSMFASHMVLQRDVPLPVWGWAAPGQEITVTFAGQTESTEVDAEGRWKIILKPIHHPGPHTMKISGPEERILEDILVGEVWLCSGQSNMEMDVAGVKHADREISQAEDNKIRFFYPQHWVAQTPQDKCEGSWSICTKDQVRHASAVAYFFGRELRKSLDCPIGLIVSSWGGTTAEAWTRRKALLGKPELQHFAEQLDKIIESYPEELKNYQDRHAAREENVNSNFVRALPAGWNKAGFDDTAWKEMDLPRHWESAGVQLDGEMVFRKTIQIPKAWEGQDLNLKLGPIDDNDQTFLNGQQVGVTQGWSIPRKYRIPGAQVNAGVATLAVRVVDSGGQGGFHGKPEQLFLEPVAKLDRQQPLSLAGNWKYLPGATLEDAPHPPLGHPSQRGLPTGLYNGMIAPLQPYAIRGATWYQGESNVGRAREYSILFPTMIEDWRSSWGEKFPFIFVQLANFLAPSAQPGESGWAELREAQTSTLSLENTGMAVAIDIGEALSIHPQNKQDVGKRLALWALANTYGKSGFEYSGPLYESHEIKAGAILVKFRHAKGLRSRGGELKHFAICGENRQWHWAKAKVEGETVVASSPKVSQPVALRYAWADNPEGCNLENGAGLPASPFRTDSPSP